MAYKKTNWVDNETPISAENLNKMEDGIVEASKTGGVLDGSIIEWEEDTIPEGYEEVEDDSGDGILVGSVIGYNGDTIPEGYEEVEEKSLINVYGDTFKLNSTNSETIPLKNILIKRGSGFTVKSDGTVLVNKDMYAKINAQIFLASGNQNARLLIIQQNGFDISYSRLTNMIPYEVIQTSAGIVELKTGDIVKLIMSGQIGDSLSMSSKNTFMALEEL